MKFHGVLRSLRCSPNGSLTTVSFRAYNDLEGETSYVYVLDLESKEYLIRDATW